MPKLDDNGHCQPHRIRLPVGYENLLEDLISLSGNKKDQQLRLIIMDWFDTKIKDRRRVQVRQIVQEYLDMCDGDHIRKSILSGKKMSF